MSKLHDALKALEPIDFTDVPLNGLDGFLKDIFTKAELAVNSVPPPAGGDDFLSASITQSNANTATSSAELTVSSARPPPVNSSHTELQKQWGKPIKLSAKENSIGTSLYKLAGNDRHGAWFARSSVHEGIGFSKFKKALLREFPETLKVKGGPGAGSIRGIGGDRRLERKVVEGVGTMEVYHLSAQFPGPTTPREFVTLFMTSDSALSDASLPDVKSSKVPKVLPRHLMIVSKPVNHPEAQARDGYVMGRYESIEFIREIPLTLARSTSSSNLLNTTDSAKKRMPLGRQRSSTISFAESRGPDAKGERQDRGRSPGAPDPELNPVEWLMITRSDPGGGIPRFMVERGTPSSIAADAAKLLDWACGKDESWFDEQAAKDGTTSAEDTGDKLAESKTETATKVPESQVAEDDSDYSSSDTSSADSFISARQFGNIRSGRRRYSASSSSSSSSTQARTTQPNFIQQQQVKEGQQSSQDLEHSNLTLRPSTTATTLQSSQNHGNQQDKLNRALGKLDHDRAALDARLEQIRERENARIQSERESPRARERAEKSLQKHEDRYARELSKLEGKRAKVMRKAETRVRKAEGKDTLLCAQHERDAARVQADALARENAMLKAQIGELQKENTALVAKMGKSEEGQRVLQLVKEEGNGSSSVFGAGNAERSRASSLKSEISAAFGGGGIVKRATAGSAAASISESAEPSSVSSNTTRKN